MFLYHPETKWEVALFTLEELGDGPYVSVCERTYTDIFWPSHQNKVLGARVLGQYPRYAGEGDLKKKGKGSTHRPRGPPLSHQKEEKILVLLTILPQQTIEGQ